MKSWQLQEAKQRLSELLRAAESQGPQAVTRHGKEVAVVLDINSYQRVRWHPSDFKDYLTAGTGPEDLEVVRDEAPAPVVELS